MNFWHKLKNRDGNQHHNPAVFWLLIIIMLMMLAGAVTILGNSDNLVSQMPTITPTESRQPRIYTVSYRGGVFSPTNLRIHAGDTVRFKNDGFFGIRIITDNNQLPGFDSVGDIPQSSYFSYTFAEKGIFGYHNNNKPEEQGTIIVR
ncbi:MAG: hypothetical protein A3C61_03485 [Candidatus Yanofskybacteria bacterium RIFCSPHIGHO2_02_FULL_39_10]|uniref:EfeO-type cupredoxin-like domain-containing protein n=1 Tax=Candidatus Yanofskybacteria bacterium RIFCSPHIGHO2_02_FULL_39_10 TaxID=1802674 RepID=A0A1F8F7W3_9BACT|nr:MAG: hypothetical protein A3C61_03485 [Candidatus Yanofskybacteria bacterium RIFCSPHIGHO2_02_FULL_39_10]